MDVPRDFRSVAMIWLVGRTWQPVFGLFSLIYNCDVLIGWGVLGECVSVSESPEPSLGRSVI